MKNLYSINILLIDDEAAGLRNNESLPAIVNDSGIDQYNEITKYFHVQWLQSPLDVKEFKVLSSEIEDKYSQSQYAKYGYLPEIIGFDYRLLAGYQSFNVNTIRHIIPTINMAQILNKSSIRNYELIPPSIKEQERILDDDDDDDDDDESDNDEFDNLYLVQNFVEGINQKLLLQKVEKTYFLPELPAHQDNFGCFGGGLITLQFRNHPCIGVPFTSKDDSSISGTDAGIFEWFLSEDFAFQRKNLINNKKLTWHELIKNGVIALREKIVIQVLSEKVQLDINQLIKYSNLETLQNLPKDERLFTFHSAYGARTIFLDALFIDQIDTEKDIVIARYMSKLFDEFGVTQIFYQDALKVVNDLWEIYSDVTIQIDLFELSALSSLQEQGLLDNSHTQKLNHLITQKAKYLNEYDGKTELKQHNLIKGKYKNNKEFMDLIVFLMMTKVYFQGSKKYKYIDDEEPYLMALFPLTSNKRNILLGDFNKIKDPLEYYKDTLSSESLVKNILFGKQDLGVFKSIMRSYWNTLLNENQILHDLKLPIWLQ